MKTGKAVQSDESTKKIYRAYLAKIEIPKQKLKPERQFFVCPIGLVGAGKTTVIKPIAKALRLIRISADEIRLLLKAHNLSYETAPEIAFRAIKYFAQQGYNVAIDSDCAAPGKRARIEKLAAEIGAKIFWLHINPPEKFILNKLKNLKIKSSGPFANKEAGVKNYFLRKPLHQKLNFPFLYTLDTSRPNLAEQIKEAINLIKKQAKK